jgi:hypothetical protein
MERGCFGILQLFRPDENPVVIATEPYDPSALGGSKFRPAIAPSAGHGLAFPDGGYICIGYMRANADTP